MNLSKTRYCNAIQCKKMLWLEDNKPNEKCEVSNDSILENGTFVGTIAKDLYGEHIDIHFDFNKEKMIVDTREALKQDTVVVTEASFQYEDNFCSIDILRKVGNEFEIIEVKSSTDLNGIYLEDVSYQYYVMKSLGYNVIKVSIAYINNKYVRHGELDIQQLFKIEDVTDYAIINYDKIRENILEINHYMQRIEEPNETIGIQCFKPYDCPYFQYCTKHLPSNNIFNVRIMQTKKKLEFYDKGIYDFKDLLNENIDFKYKQQIDFELNNKEPYIDKEYIREFMKGLYYPLYFLDFETYQQPIPLYDNIRPYMQIPFQYSLHYITDENSELNHKEFLADANVDPRRRLAEQLVHDIPLNACTLAYNMSFEKTVIKNLAELYEDLKEHLMNIHDHIQDLMLPFINRKYYTKEMKGSYSIKYVLPALFPNDPSLDYHNLSLVHNGSEASNTFANLGNLTEEEQSKARESLLKYCELDTYAMVKIWQKLKEVIE